MAETKWPPKLCYDVIIGFIVFIDPQNIGKDALTVFLYPLFQTLWCKYDISIMAKTKWPPRASREKFKMAVYLIFFRLALPMSVSNFKLLSQKPTIKKNYAHIFWTFLGPGWSATSSIGGHFVFGE